MPKSTKLQKSTKVKQMSKSDKEFKKEQNSQNVLKFEI